MRTEKTRLQLRRVATNKVNKQLWTADKEWASSLGLERGANSLEPWIWADLKITCDINE
jgi:hypothetical protein